MPFKCFSVVKKVLEDTYVEIQGDEENRDREIASAIEKISESYLNMSKTGPGPDFQDPVSRFAYVYAYVPAHAHWVSELISWTPEAIDVFEKDKVRIACIGGGPGSDLIGILKYLDDRGGEPPSIFCEIADGCELWKHTWADLSFSLDLPVRLNTDYVVQRVGETDVWKHPVQFEKSDIISMSFLSLRLLILARRPGSMSRRFSGGQRQAQYSCLMIIMTPESSSALTRLPLGLAGRLFTVVREQEKSTIKARIRTS
jgi:hypothetical protein